MSEFGTLLPFASRGRFFTAVDVLRPERTHWCPVAVGFRNSDAVLRLLRIRCALDRFDPDSCRNKIRTNNPLERIMKEIRRRTRVVGAFPDGQFMPEPGRGADCRHIAGTASGQSRKYMNMNRSYQEREHANPRSPSPENKCAKDL
jgi:hypothetical protein